MRRDFLAVLMAVLLVGGCAPQALQSAQLVGDNNGRSRYAMSGYTDTGEIEPGASRKHIDYALSDACPAGVDIISLNEAPSGNIAGKFLYWEAVAECR